MHSTIKDLLMHWLDLEGSLVVYNHIYKSFARFITIGTEHPGEKMSLKTEHFDSYVREEVILKIVNEISAKMQEIQEELEKFNKMEIKMPGALKNHPAKNTEEETKQAMAGMQLLNFPSSKLNKFSSRKKTDSLMQK
jgi:hypothetical protein